MSDGLAARLSRFSLVGLAATLTYFLVAGLLVLATPVKPTTASLVGYCCGMPISFFGQSRFTFRVAKNRLSHLLKFAVVTALGMTVSYGSILLAGALHAHPLAGVLMGTVAVPAMSFAVMNLWVFCERGIR